MSFTLRRAMLAAAALAIVPIAPAPHAEDKPAVSTINGKLDVSGGDLDGESMTVVSGALAVPVTHRLGAQLDAAMGDVSASVLKGYGGHFFWRDPDVGLAGIVASRTGFDTTWGNRFGGEAEAYFGPVTLAAMAGWQNGELRHTGWGGVDLRYYPLDDLMLETGASAYGADRFGHVGVEWRPGLLAALPGLALFGDAGFGSNDYEHALTGIRVYFGGADKPLIRRHREDDPLNMLVGGVSQVAAPAAGGIPGLTAPTATTPAVQSSGSGGGGAGAGGGGGGGGGF